MLFVLFFFPLQKERSSCSGLALSLWSVCFSQLAFSSWICICMSCSFSFPVGVELGLKGGSVGGSARAAELGPTCLAPASCSCILCWQVEGCCSCPGPCNRRCLRRGPVRGVPASTLQQEEAPFGTTVLTALARGQSLAEGPLGHSIPALGGPFWGPGESHH